MACYGEERRRRGGGAGGTERAQCPQVGGGDRPGHPARSRGRRGRLGFPSAAWNFPAGAAQGSRGLCRAVVPPGRSPPRAHRAGPASLLGPPARTLGLVVGLPLRLRGPRLAAAGRGRLGLGLGLSGGPKPTARARPEPPAGRPRPGAGPGGRAGAALTRRLRWPRARCKVGGAQSPLAFSPGATPGAGYQQSLPCLGCRRESALSRQKRPS
ncbi:uncharacterized protein [Chlorocebus sabaeus]|uniref:uncharacterized protein n=1 Tax=Chlorocebus sabaeus TaxID=60711 RepID=UPI003BF9647B